MSDLITQVSAFKKTPMGEKFVRFILGVGILTFVVWIGNMALPHLIKFFKQGTLALGWGVTFAITSAVVFLCCLAIWKNRTRFWMWYTGLCNKLGRNIVKQDPLEFMKTGIDIFTAKFEKLKKNKKIVRGKETYIAGEIKRNTDLMKEELELANAARKLNRESTLTLHAGNANTYKKSVEMLTPIYERINKNRVFLDQLEENWGNGLKQLRTQVSVMETTWETLKATSDATDLAEEFINASSEEGRIFIEAKKNLEQNMADMLANIDNFEERTRPVIESMEMQKQVNAAQGLSLLEELIDNEKILLPSNMDAWKETSTVPQTTSEFDKLI